MAKSGGTRLTLRMFLVLGVVCLLLTNMVDAKDEKDDKKEKSKKTPSPSKDKSEGSKSDDGGKTPSSGKEKSDGSKSDDVGKSSSKGSEKGDGSKSGDGGDAAPAPPAGGGDAADAPPADAGGDAAAAGGSQEVYDVTKFGAKPDGRTSNEISFTKAWRAACDSSGPAKLLIPSGSFVAGETVFQGPCAGKKAITVEIVGTLLAQSDPSSYSGKAWISIEKAENVVVTGGGTIDGRGKSMWQYAGGDSPLPTSLQFQGVANSKMNNLNFVNSMGVHVKVSDCHDIELTKLTITAPDQSPNTDGIHTSNTTNLQITNSVIGTGDDCVALGHGSTDVVVTGITCGPGHGISIGSLGKRPDELNVKGITVSKCTLKGTDNGARIKTFQGSKVMTATGITFEDITLDGVKNPILIDQHYQSKSRPDQSRVKLTDIHYRNIKGTSTSPVAIALLCSSAAPCEGVELSNIDIKASDGTGALSTSCEYAKTTVTELVGLGALKCT